jgi:hypothetical protein
MPVYLNSMPGQSLFCDEEHLRRKLEFLEDELIRTRAGWREQIGLELALRSYRLFRLGEGDGHRFECWRILQIALESLAQLERSSS